MLLIESNELVIGVAGVSGVSGGRNIGTIELPPMLGPVMRVIGPESYTEAKGPVGVEPEMITGWGRGALGLGCTVSDGCIALDTALDMLPGAEPKGRGLGCTVSDG